MMSLRVPEIKPTTRGAAELGFRPQAVLATTRLTEESIPAIHFLRGLIVR
jgi:hypothetical protein